MTLLRVNFAGSIMKAEHKQAGSKPICEVSVCKKHKGRNGAEDTYTWLRVTLWEPATFQVDKLVKGNFIAGSGDLQLRSYVDKAGAKGHSLECRSTSFDVEVSGAGDAPEPAAAAAPVRSVPRANSSGVVDEIPFAYDKLSWI